jgi:hypothetical protein
VRRFTPNTAKNSFQKVCEPSRSRVSPAQSREKLMAFVRISFQERGIGFGLERGIDDESVSTAGAEGNHTWIAWNIQAPTSAP